MTTVEQDITTIWKRILPRVVHENDCWLWSGAKLPSGYGRYGYRINGQHKSGYVHRLSYAVNHGPIPDGLEIDHICRNRNCINPAHLEAVTHRVNMLRGDTFAGRQHRQTHCRRGHLFDERNTYISKDGERDCRACNVIQQRERRNRCRQQLATN